MNTSKKLGIYVHIPFCKKKCDYCDFTSFSNKNELVDEYINTLKKEILATNLERDDYIIETIYFGGGTPSYIESRNICDVLEVIKNKFNILKEAEITVEVNPGTITEEKLTMYKSAGINRLSIGLQSTKNELLKSIGRIHNYDEFLNTYNLARKLGFSNINVDLMIGLPNQTVEDIENAISEISKLNPEHISIYSLIVEEGTKLAQRLKKNEMELPSEEIEREMYWTAKRELERLGYKQYEISNFSKEGFKSQHNWDCWNQEEYIGFGIAAHSYINNIRYSNVEELKKYVEDANSKIINEVQTTEDKMKEYMLLGLRKIEGVKISEFKNRFIENPIYIYRQELDRLVNEELLEVDINNIKLTNKGIDLANLVWKEFV